jgi:uncharacterized membrane protein YecN with MAPEG domain
MSDIISSIIVGILALLGVVITNMSNNKRTDIQLEKSQAIMDTKLEELTREVRMHNNFAHEIPVIKEQIKSLDCRIHELEDK